MERRLGKKTNLGHMWEIQPIGSRFTDHTDYLNKTHINPILSSPNFIGGKKDLHRSLFSIVQSNRHKNGI